jgi:Domain of unknown function (DUF5666)
MKFKATSIESGKCLSHNEFVLACRSRHEAQRVGGRSLEQYQEKIMFIFATWRRRVSVSAVLAGLMVSMLLASCGGGGTGGTGGTGEPAPSNGANLAVGPITGFGSIIVNGVRYDDSSASIVDDDDSASSRDELKLGVVVEVKSGTISNGSAPALGIAFGSSLVGPVDAGSQNTTENTLKVLGQTVKVTNATVYGEGLTGLASIVDRAIVNVHGILDAGTGVTTATRIELKLNPQHYRLRGKVSDLNTTLKTLKIGGQSVSYAEAQDNPALRNLANDQVVRARLKTAKQGDFWVATRIKSSAPSMDGVKEFEVKGVISNFISTTNFKINDLQVDASKAVFEEDDQSELKLGVLVEVEGAMLNDVLVARKVEVEDKRDQRSPRFELHGAITVIDTAAKTFGLRGQTVSFGTAQYKNGVEADLKVGARVEIKGVLSTDKTKIEAKSIEFER